MEDAEIVTLFWNRDEEALTQAKAKYGVSLQTVAENILGNRADAEECVNDAYLNTWNSIPPNRPVHLFSWMAKIARNLSLQKIEKEGRQRRSAEVVSLSEELAECLASQDGVEEWLERQRFRAVLNNWLNAQSAEKRYLFARRYFYGDSYEDLARHSGKSQAAVRKTLSRMRAELREQLSGKEKDE